ncbi:MAG: tetratricopeptide repeat protein [Fimbriimonadaceae bacterium]
MPGAAPFFLLVRVRGDNGPAAPQEWLLPLAERCNAAHERSDADHVFKTDSARDALELALLVQTQRLRRPLFQSSVVAFGGDDGLGASARLRRLESLADQARPGAVLGVGNVVGTLSPLTKGMRSRPLGRHRFDDLLPAEEIVSYAAGEAHDPPSFSLEGLDFYDHNLPVFFDSFVGRLAEIDDVIGASSTTRLVTLCGCGGSGKTRLALHSAARLAHDGFDLLRLVRLASLDRSADVGAAIASQSGIRSSRMDDLVAAYRSRRCLFVLDNCEHVLSSAVEAVRRLIHEVPGAQVLATSREIMDIGGEVAIEVPPLDVPAADATHSDRQYIGAVELFCDRMTERAPGFSLSAANFSAVAAICRKVDGLPLALEHAAGQAAFLGLEECELGLARRFDLLRSSRRDYDERHRTVWATIDWSHELLSDKERHCLGSLSVFAGSFSMLDATAIVSDETVTGASAPSVLTSLIRKSLVVREFDSRGNSVYHLLETVREFAREKAVSRLEAVRERHFAFVRELIDGAYATSEGRPSPIKFEDLQPRYADVKAALDWAVDHCHKLVDEALRRMTRYWIEYGPVSDGVDLLSRAVQPAIDSGEFSCDIANALGAMLWMDGKLDEALFTFERVLEKAQADGQHLAVANAHNNLAGVAMTLGKHDSVEGHLRAAYKTYLVSGEATRAAICAGNLGYNLARTGRSAEAIGVMNSALLDADGRLPIESEAGLMLNLGDALRLGGRPEESLHVLREILAKCAGSDHPSTVPKAILRSCLVIKETHAAGDIARLYGMAAQGYAEFAAKEFAERAELRVEVEEFLDGELESAERDRLIASGAVIAAADRATMALKILSKALDRLTN